jgi:hypothetical protein
VKEYFDKSHLNFGKFIISNNDTITFNKYDGYYHHILSPVKISETFTSFSYKVIKTFNNKIMYGIGSSELKNNQPDQYLYKNFIGYCGYNDGSVVD